MNSVFARLHGENRIGSVPTLPTETDPAGWAALNSVARFLLGAGRSTSTPNEAEPEKREIGERACSGQGSTRRFAANEEGRAVIDAAKVAELGSYDAILSYFNDADFTVPPLRIQPRTAIEPAGYPSTTPSVIHRR